MDVREIKIYKFTASFTAWLTVSLLLVTLVTYIIAIATPAWGVVNILDNTYVVSGLWTRCEHYSSIQKCHSLVGSDGVSDTFVTAQCLSVLGLLAVSLALTAAGAYVFIAVFNKDQRVAFLTAILAVVSAILIVITCVTFTLGDKEDAMSTIPSPSPVPITFTMSYSFGFAIFSAMIATASAGLVTFELFNAKHGIPM